MGWTGTVDPRTAPTWGVITTKLAFVTCQNRFTVVPKPTVVWSAVNEVIAGAAPVGTFDCV